MINYPLGSFEWVSNTSLTVPSDSWRWNLGEPSGQLNMLNDSCVEIVAWAINNIGMNDVDCNKPNTFICEKVNLPCKFGNVSF